MLCLALTGLSVLGAFFLLPSRMNYQITEKVIVSNPEREAAVYFSLLTPKTGPYQSVSQLSIDWDGPYQENNFESVKAIRFSALLEPEQTLQANLEYQVKLKQGKVSWTGSVKNFQTQPQVGIESQHELIQERATEISHNLIGDLPYKIYSFTTEHLTYAQAQEDCAGASALKSYQIGSCFCAGYARLMVALSRAAGIPSQVMVGFLYPDPLVKSSRLNNLENPGEPHAWVEINDYGKWTIADPTWGDGTWKRFFFGRNDGRHVAYGELEEISKIHNTQKYWVFEQTENPVKESDCFRIVADSTSQATQFILVSSVEKVWDGRWINAIVVWLVMVVLICRLRRFIIPWPADNTFGEA